MLLPACCCLRLPATYLLACCYCLPRLLPAVRLLLLLASACLPTCCLLPASSASCLVLPSPPPLWPHLAPPWVAWCFPRRRLSGLIWLRPGSGWRLRSEALPLPRLEITLIRPCRSMRKYADKRHVDVATLRPFGQFLYLLPPWAAKMASSSTPWPKTIEIAYVFLCSERSVL